MKMLSHQPPAVLVVEAAEIAAAETADVTVAAEIEIEADVVIEEIAATEATVAAIEATAKIVPVEKTPRPLQSSKKLLAHLKCRTSFRRRAEAMTMSTPSSDHDASSM